MRLIDTVGWAIYPAGYLFGYLLGEVDDVYLGVIFNSRISSTRLGKLQGTQEPSTEDVGEKRKVEVDGTGATWCGWIVGGPDLG